MPKRTDIFSILALGAAAVAVPLSAQEIAPVSVTLIDGVEFVGEGGVELSETADGTEVASFWRPLQYRQDGKLIAGRMECRAAAQRTPFHASLFQLDEVHAAQLSADRLDGMAEIDTRYQRGDILRRFDVQTRRLSPRRYYVLTYIAIRTESDLVNIRQTCGFLRDAAIYRHNFMPYVDRHTEFLLDLPPPDIADPSSAPSLESLTDIDS